MQIRAHVTLGVFADIVLDRRRHGDNGRFLRRLSDQAVSFSSALHRFNERARSDLSENQAGGLGETNDSSKPSPSVEWL